MPHITFSNGDGGQRTLEAAEGLSVMQVAVDNGVPGIMGECGGCATCATCKVIVDAEWLARLTPPDENEISVLDGEPPEVRLSCQIKVTAATDGLIVGVPASQYR